MEKIRAAVFGYGCRGRDMLNHLLSMEDIAVIAVCDTYPDRADAAGKACAKHGHPAAVYTDDRKLFDKERLDAAFIFTAWEAHVKIAVNAMNAGVRPAFEVGGAHSLEECQALVRTSERTRIPVMMLENCCYGETEMTLLHMVRKGVFGELIHCQGAYEHDLREEVAMGLENRHYRFHNYLYRNGDNYPTHALLPIAKYLKINRGNRFLSLVSMSSKSRGLHEWIAANKGAEHAQASLTFRQGDVVNTLIQCAGGETILLTLDTTLPRPYSRGGRVQGTKGLWQEDGNLCFFEGNGKGESWSHTFQSFAPLLEQYRHPLWRHYRDDGVQQGHGGMDYLVLRAFIESVKEGKDPPIDVYDAASCMAVTYLSEQSIALGSAPVAFPDFTNCKWIDRSPCRRSRFCLDEVCEECF